MPQALHARATRLVGAGKLSPSQAGCFRSRSLASHLREYRKGPTSGPASRPVYAGSPPQSGQESLPGAGVLEDVADFSCRFAAASTQGDPAMTWRRILCPRLARTVLLPLGLTVFLAFSAAVGQPRKIDVLRIGSSGSLASEAPG